MNFYNSLGKSLERFFFLTYIYIAIYVQQLRNSDANLLQTPLYAGGKNKS